MDPTHRSIIPLSLHTPRIYYTSQDPRLTPAPHDTFLPYSASSQSSVSQSVSNTQDTDPIEPPSPPKSMVHTVSPSPIPLLQRSQKDYKNTSSSGWIEDLTDTQWEAPLPAWSSSGRSDGENADLLEKEGRRIMELEGRRLAKRAKEDPRRNKLDELRAKRARRSLSREDSRVNEPILSRSISKEGGLAAPIDLSASPSQGHASPILWSPSPKHTSKGQSLKDFDEGELDQWIGSSKKKNKVRKVVIASEDEADGFGHEEDDEQRSTREDTLVEESVVETGKKGKARAGEPKSELAQRPIPTLDDLFVDDEDTGATLDPALERYDHGHGYENENGYADGDGDEYDEAFEAGLAGIDFDTFESPPPPFPTTHTRPVVSTTKTTTRTPLKALSSHAQHLPSSASTLAPPTPKTSEAMNLEHPLILIPDLPEDVQEFYLNHWRRGADNSRAGDEEYEDELREKRDAVKKKAAAGARKFGRGGFGFRGRGRGRGRGKAVRGGRR